eukprot:TRINITY_DN2629_c0_g5_i1.p1 TRINITY_DN2629_c0_g5~~TRINITY_DN2629_c0_g5_i1.p1  ORF type:complete len:379 (+),score=92.69 TRINITY_DN2629_c0_g5_i1:53-1138(+)
MAATHLNSKSDLNTLCQIESGRPIGKGDVDYIVTKVDGLSTATVVINCLGGQEFEGQPCLSDKEAHQSAAAIALETLLLPHGGVMPERPKKKAKTDATSPFDKPVAPVAPVPTPKGKGKGKGVTAVVGKGLGKAPLHSIAAPKAMAKPAGLVTPTLSGGPEANWKTLLNTHLMRYTKRPLSKDDLHYDLAECVEGFQATLTINALEECPAFIGQPAKSHKQAHQNAAYEAMQVYAGEFGLDLNALSGGFAAGTMDPAAADAMRREMNGSATPKCKLNEYVAKVIRRPLVKNEVEYETSPVAEGGFQSAVTLHPLPDEYAGQTIVGEVAQDKKAAEQSAAEQANEWLMSLFANEITAPKKKK